MESEFTRSHAVLKAFVPLTTLSDDQLDVLLAKASSVSLYQGQELMNPGNIGFEYIYLIHGTLAVYATSNPEPDFIEAGTKIGMLPLSHDGLSQQRIVAQTDSRILTIETSTLEKILCWGAVTRCFLSEIATDTVYDQEYFWIKNLLESNLFYKVPPTNIYSILNSFQEMTVKVSTEVIVQGDEGTCCYLMKSGAADVIINQHVVARLNQGVVFGEEALVSSKPRNATVKMVSDGVLMKLEKAEFYKLIKQPEVVMIGPNKVKALAESGVVLLDVRSQEEYETGHIDQAINMPLHLCYLKSAMLNKQLNYITYSATDERSKAAAYLLSNKGFHVSALEGGVKDLLSL